MKRIICLISALTLFTAVFSGCGNDKPNKKTPVLDDGEGGLVIVRTEPVTTLPKIKLDNVDSDEQTATNSTDKATDENKNVSDGEDVSDVNGDDVSDTSGNSSDNVTGSSAASSSSQTATSATQTSTTPVELYYLEGIVYSVSDNGSVTLKDPDIGWVRASFGNKSDLKDVRVGDKVLVTHNGKIGESFPAVTMKTYGIEVTEKAPEECTLKQFECKNLDYNLNFSILVPNSWSSMNIDYPTEGDFTDWGVRFTPNGETKGLDISWHSSFAILEPYDITPITVNGIELSRYSKKGKWRFYVYDNDCIAANTFYNTSGYDEYTDDMEFMLETLEFEDVSFLS